MRKGDTVFYIANHQHIVKALVVKAKRNGTAKVEARYFYNEGRATSPFIGETYDVMVDDLFPSELAADYEIQSRRGLTL